MPGRYRIDLLATFYRIPSVELHLLDQKRHHHPPTLAVAAEPSARRLLVPPQLFFEQLHDILLLKWVERKKMVHTAHELLRVAEVLAALLTPHRKYHILECPLGILHRHLVPSPPNSDPSTIPGTIPDTSRGTLQQSVQHAVPQIALQHHDGLPQTCRSVPVAHHQIALEHLPEKPSHVTIKLVILLDHNERLWIQGNMVDQRVLEQPVLLGDILVAIVHAEKDLVRRTSPPRTPLFGVVQRPRG